MAATVKTRITQGIRETVVNFEPPVQLTADLYTTTWVRNQPRELGWLVAGTQVLRLCAVEEVRGVWLTVRTAAGDFGNECAESWEAVLESLGVDGLALCDGCALPYDYAEGKDDAHGSRVCRACQELAAREDAEHSDTHGCAY